MKRSMEGENLTLTSLPNQIELCPIDNNFNYEGINGIGESKKESSHLPNTKNPESDNVYMKIKEKLSESITSHSQDSILDPTSELSQKNVNKSESNANGESKTIEQEEDNKITTDATGDSEISIVTDTLHVNDTTKTIVNGYSDPIQPTFVDLTCTDSPQVQNEVDNEHEDLEQFVNHASTVLCSNIISMLQEPFKLGFTRTLVLRSKPLPNRSRSSNCDVYYNHTSTKKRRLRSHVDVSKLLAVLSESGSTYAGLDAEHHFSFRTVRITSPPHAHENITRAKVKLPQENRPGPQCSKRQPEQGSLNSSLSTSTPPVPWNPPGPLSSKKLLPLSSNPGVNGRAQTVDLPPLPKIVYNLQGTSLRALKRKCPPDMLRAVSVPNYEPRFKALRTKTVAVVERASEEFLAQRYPEWDRVTISMQAHRLINRHSELEDVPNKHGAIPAASWRLPCSRFCLPDGSLPSVTCASCLVQWHRGCLPATAKPNLFICHNCLCRIKNQKLLAAKKKSVAITEMPPIKPDKKKSAPVNLPPFLKRFVSISPKSTALLTPTQSTPPTGAPSSSTLGRSSEDNSSMVLDSPFSVVYSTEEAVCLELPNTSLTSLSNGNVLITIPKVPGLERILEQRHSYLRVNQRTYAVEPRNIGHFESVYKILLPDPPKLTNPVKMIVVITLQPSEVFGAHSPSLPSQTTSTADRVESPSQFKTPGVSALSMNSFSHSSTKESKQRHVKLQVNLKRPGYDPFILDMLPSLATQSLFGQRSMTTIFSKLSPAELCTCRLVCRQWKHIIDSLDTWSEVSLPSTEVHNWVLLGCFLGRRSTRSLNLHISSELKNSVVMETNLGLLAKSSVRLIDSLESLSVAADFAALFRVENLSISKLLTPLTNLRFLKIQSSSSLRVNFDHLSECTNIFPLEILELETFKDFCLLETFDPVKFPKLRTVVLDEFNKMDPDIKFSPIHITKLILRYRSESFKSIHFLGLLTKLKSLVLVSSKTWGRVLADHFAPQPCLTNAQIFCHSVSEMRKDILEDFEGRSTADDSPVEQTN